MQTVIGLFENAHDAQNAAQQLVSEGFSSNNIDVSVKNTGSELSGGYSSDVNSSEAFQNNSSSGNSLTGSTAAYIPGSNYTTDSITGSGLNYSDNTSVKHSNTGDDNSFGDKVSKFFKNLFNTDENEASRYSDIANKTGCIVTVHAQSKDEAERAADILDDNGAIDVDKKSAEYGYSNSFSAAPTSGNTDTLNVIKEDVEIGKKEIETGGVRLRSKIVERPVQEELRLREEKITVNRKVVDRPATIADFENFKEGEIEMTEYAEIPEVKKQARIVEEVTIAKEVKERKETVSEIARDTEVEVEDFSKNKLGGTKNDNY